MADYQKMYTALFNAISDVIVILQRAQQITEEQYISTEQPNITVLEITDGDSDGEHSN